jgi:hypothetical protein
MEERDRQLAAIDKELPAVLRELLGVNYERELNRYFVDAGEDDRRLAFLSEDKRAQMLALRDQFEGARERILYQAQKGKLTPGDLEKLRELDRQQDEALAGVLTPGEKEQYDLSTSPAADQLRQQLIGFNPTEGEFRDLYRRQKAISEAYEFEDANDPAVIAAKAADEADMMKEFKSGLASDRAAQLERSQDPDYQSLCELSARFNLPAETSDTLTAMRQAAEEEKQKLLSNNDVPPERLEVALKAIQAETEKAAREALGDQAYGLYSQSAGWIKKLGRN